MLYSFINYFIIDILIYALITNCNYSFFKLGFIYFLLYQGKTRLPLPPAKLFSSDVSEKYRIHSLETILIGWTKQIQVCQSILRWRTCSGLKNPSSKMIFGSFIKFEMLYKIFLRVIKNAILNFII